MKKAVFFTLLMVLFLSTVFTQVEQVEKQYDTITWQQPATWLKAEEMTVPGAAYYQGKVGEGMVLKDGVIFVLLTENQYVQNMINDMHEDDNTVIRVSGEDVVNGMKRAFYSGTTDENGNSMEFMISHFPGEDSGKEFLTVAMIKGPKARDYKNMVEAVNKSMERTTGEKVQIVKPESIIVTKTTLSVDKTVYLPSEDMKVTFRNAPGESNSEWVGLYKVGDGNMDYITWEYLNGQKNGEFYFVAPDQPGDYLLKLFSPDSMDTEVAISQAFTVETNTVPEQVYALNIKPADKIQYLPGEVIEVDYEIPESIIVKYPWIGIIPSDIAHGSESENDSHDLTYQYLREETGTLIFKAPSTEGNYDFRLNDSDSNGVEQAYISFTVKDEIPAAVLVEKTAYDIGSKIALEFSNAPAEGANDWIGLYMVGTEDTQYISWLYLQGQTDGTAEFNAPDEPGDYQFRMFRNNSYEKIAESTTFTVKSLQPAELESLFINDYKLSSQLVEKKPVDVKVRFTFEDERIYMWLQIDKYIDAHEARWEWIKPDGSLYDNVDLTMKSAAEYGYLSLSNYGMWSWLTISNIDRADAGIWKVNFYLDDDLLITRQFILR
jgi:hypothetical protein